MGQYFKFVNIDKDEQVTAWDLGGLAKVSEWQHSDIRNIILFLTDSATGSWAKNHIALIGDYDSSKLWEKTDEYKKAKFSKFKAFNQNHVGNKDKLIFVNHTLKEYIVGTYNQLGICAIWLLAQSDGGGGGDFEYMDDAGDWAYSSIETIFGKEKFNGYEDISSEVFKEAFYEYKRD
jgi:hypothetical protein